MLLPCGTVCSDPSGRGLRGNSATCSALGWLSVTSPATHKQIGPFWCWFLGGWVCACSRTLWVSPINSPVRLGVSPVATSTPTSVFSQRLWHCISPHWNPWLLGQSCSPVVPPGLSAHKCETAQSTSHHLACPSPPAAALPRVLSSRLPVSDPFTSLDECFLFESLVVGLPYGSIFWQFWLFFCF